MHLLVDGVCGAVLASYALQESQLEPILFHFALYTVFAFGLQGPVGWFLDTFPNYLKPGFIASILLLVGGSMPQLPIGAQACLLGLGNCFFHVVGGTYVLSSFNSFTPLGLFVSSGAFGLGLGLNSLVGVVPLLSLAVIFTLYTVRLLPETFLLNQGLTYKPNIPFKPLLPFWGVAVLLLSCIVLRGFGSGGDVNTPFLMLLPCTLTLGKLLGGIVCDKLGYKNTVILIFAIGFIALQLQGLYAGLLFILVCNMTMPLTLRLAHWCRLGSPGLMFGLAASCLVPGSIFKGVLNFPPQLILVLQFLILSLAGYVLLPKEYHHV